MSKSSELDKWFGRAANATTLITVVATVGGSMTAISKYVLDVSWVSSILNGLMITFCILAFPFVWHKRINWKADISDSTIGLKKGLFIHSAIYGANGEYREAVKLKDKISNDRIEIRTLQNHDLVVEDPIKSEKTLFIAYSVDDDGVATGNRKIKFIAAKESEALKVPSIADGDSGSLIADPWLANVELDKLRKYEKETPKLNGEVKRLTDGIGLLQDKLSEGARHLRIKDEEIGTLSKRLDENEKQITELSKSVADHKDELEAFTIRMQDYQRRINWLEFSHEMAPRVKAALGRAPKVRIQHYTGQDNKELAAKVVHFFRNISWDTTDPIEVASTDLSNPEVGARIMISYPKALIPVFHDATTKIEYAALRHSGFFDPEKIIRDVQDNDFGSDLLVTIFPKTFWD